MDTTTTLDRLLTQIMDRVHPLMAEGLHLAAIPQWVDARLFGAMRQRDDGRDEGLIERLTRYSFIVPLGSEPEGEPAFMVRPEERIFLQRHWITQDLPAYRTAHSRALEYWKHNQDPNQFAQAQNRLFHQLIVDTRAGMDFLVDRFRAYHNDRQLTAIENMLNTAGEARFYLAIMAEPTLPELDDLLSHLKARLAQLQGRWTESLEPLKRLRGKRDLPIWLRPYVMRAYGRALAETNHFVEAISEYESALALFEQQSTAIAETAGIHAERAYTMIALGDAYMGLAKSARGHVDIRPPQPDQLQKLFEMSQVIFSLPLMIYLSGTLGRRVWHPRFWPTLQNLDWIIARLFAVGARWYRQADPILEQFGQPSEGVAADEKLAVLYLAMGDANQAELLFEQILADKETPLGEYRQATIRVGLGHARLRLNKFAAAQEALEQALPMLQLYQDQRLGAKAEALLGETLVELDQVGSAINRLRRALSLYHQQNNTSEVTTLAERLESLADEARLPAQDRAAAQKSAGKITHRQYPVRYRHPATVINRRLILILVAVFIFLTPILVIRFESGTSVLPDITFNATPLLRSDSPNFTPDLSQGVVAISLAPAQNPEFLVWLGIVLFVLELLISTGAGILAITRTSLAKVQAQTRATAVHLSPDGLQIGQQSAAWPEIDSYKRADTALIYERLADDSVTVVTTPGSQLIISGSTAWYSTLQKHLEQKIPASAVKSDLSYSLLRSKMGAWYLATIVFLIFLSILGRLLPDLVLSSLPFLPYGLADLTPFLYLGLFIPPLVWFLLKPVQMHRRFEPGSRLGWWLGGIGLALTLLRVLLLFRPWLTVPEIYPQLFILALTGSALMLFWPPANSNFSAKRQPGWLRISAGLVVTAVFLLMGLNILRELGSYHFMLLGDARRDQAQETADPAGQVQLRTQAVAAYTQSIRWSEIRILGIDSQAAVRIPLGIPRPHRFSWVAAMNGRAAMHAQLANYQAAIKDYTALLNFSDRQAAIYAGRALAYQGWGTTTSTDESGMVEVKREYYNQALADFDRSIALKPNNASYFLWRGVAYHALGGETSGLIQQAKSDYETALALTRGKQLNASGRAKALTGLGWIAYAQKAYGEAVSYFEDAVAADKSLPDAYLGLGYANYSLRDYEQALAAWTTGAELAPDNPTMITSLGTLYWRLGTIGSNLESSGTDRCANANLGLTQTEKLESASLLQQSIDYLTAAAEIEGQDPADVAFTYRTLGQVTYLLRECPNYDRLGVLQESIDSYSKAISADPQNPVYWQFRGRLRYAAWLNAPADAGPSARVWLFDGLDDLEQAIALDPVDRNTDYRPNWWWNLLHEEAVNGSLSRGDAFFEAGDYAKALGYYDLVATRQPDHAGAAMKAGLASLALDDIEQALNYYQSGVERAAASRDSTAIRQAQAELKDFLGEHPGVNAPIIERLLSGQ